MTLKKTIVSEFSLKRLTERWDERTSPQRFAGANETLDVIFMGKRRGNRVSLVRRTTAIRDPFACRFFGKLVETESGSAICGWFRKSIFDYILISLITFLWFYMIYEYRSRSADNTRISAMVLIGVAFVYFLTKNGKREKERFAELLRDIAADSR